MQMIFRKARHERVAPGVDNLCIWPRERPHLGIRSDAGDTAIFAIDRLGARLVRVHGEDFGAEDEDGVDGRHGCSEFNKTSTSASSKPYFASIARCAGVPI